MIMSPISQIRKVRLGVHHNLSHMVQLVSGRAMAPAILFKGPPPSPMPGTLQGLGNFGTILRFITLRAYKLLTHQRKPEKRRCLPEATQRRVFQTEEQHGEANPQCTPQEL
jgi:hypothetical protein